MRDLFFKTTKSRHPSHLLRFVYSFLRVRRRVSFFVRPRSRNSAFFRMQILRRMFAWFYTDQFARKHLFRRLIRMRATNFRTFLSFCTTLESYIPVIAYRFHFVDNMRNAFFALRARFFFKNGFVVTNIFQPLCIGDVLEFFFDRVFLELGKAFLIRCLPTTRVSFGITDTFIDTRLFHACFLNYQMFFSYAKTSFIHRMPYKSLFDTRVQQFLNRSNFDGSRFLYMFLLAHAYRYLYRQDERNRLYLFKHFFFKSISSLPVSRSVGHFWFWETLVPLYSFLPYQTLRGKVPSIFLFSLFNRMQLVTSKLKSSTERFELRSDMSESVFFLKQFLDSTFGIINNRGPLLK